MCGKQSQLQTGIRESRSSTPGPGVGGHCISVDPWFLVEAAPQLSPLVRTAREVNDSQPEYVVRWMERKIGNLAGKRILALGLSYKPDVDDFRESPAVEVVELLQKAGAQVQGVRPVCQFDPCT